MCSCSYVATVDDAAAVAVVFCSYVWLLIRSRNEMSAHTHTHTHTCTHLSMRLHACIHTHSATNPPAHTHMNQTEQQQKLQMHMTVNQSHLLPSESTNFQDSLDCERMVRSKVVSPDETTQFSISGGQTRLVFHLKSNSHWRCCNKAKQKNDLQMCR